MEDVYQLQQNSEPKSIISESEVNELKSPEKDNLDRAMDDNVKTTLLSPPTPYNIVDAPLQKFAFRNGYISYKNIKAIFKIPKICELRKGWREGVTKVFRIKVYPPSEGTSRKKFEFESIKDLEYVLDFCQTYASQRNGSYNIPWQYVTFSNYKLTIPCNIFGGSSHNIYTYRDTKLMSSFNKIKDYIERSCPQLVARVKDSNIIGVSNFQPLLELIPKFKNEFTQRLNFDTSNDSIQKYLRPGSAFPLDKLKGRSEFSKSPYLSHLCKIHLLDFKVFYLLESINHESSESSQVEYGYLFTINKTYDCVTLVFENITDESRASLVFKIKIDGLEEAIIDIKDFLSSNLKNKRQLLAKGMITFNNNSILSVSRISHTDLYTWKWNLI